MSKAYEAYLNCLTFKNEATTTIPAYCFVRLCTTNNSVDIITTRGTVAPIGISQEAINPSKTGAIAIDGVSRFHLLEMPAEYRYRVQLVHRNTEKTLHLFRVQRHGQYPVHPARLDKIGYQPRRNRYSRHIFLV